MKRLLLLLIVGLAFAGTLCAQDKDKNQDQEPTQDPVMQDSDKFFLPKDTLWGYAQFDLAPPHNEIDPNMCAGNAGAYGGVNAPCSLFARYMLSGLLEVRPFGKGRPAPLHGLGTALVSIRQDHSADLVHLVARRYRD